MWIKPRNLVIEIYDYYNIPNIDFKYNYLVTFDLESILLKTPNSSNNTSKLKFISTHVVVSASMTSNLPNFTNANLSYQLILKIYVIRYFHISMNYRLKQQD